MPPPPPFGFTRLYVGHLSPDVRISDLEDKFGRFGRLVDVRIMGTFAFVEFDDPRDADDAQYELDGRSWMGERLLVQPAKRPPREGPAPGPGPVPGPVPGPIPPRGRGPPRMPPGPPPGQRRGKYRLFLSNLPPGTSWQDVKDLGRKYGWVSFADVDPYRRDEGILEFDSPDVATDALFGIDGASLRGNTIQADPEDPDVVPGRRRPPPAGSPLPPPSVRRSPSPRGHRSPPPVRGAYRDDPRGYRSPPPAEPRDGYRSPPPAERRGGDSPRPAEPREEPSADSYPTGKHSPEPSSAPEPIEEDPQEGHQEDHQETAAPVADDQPAPSP